MGCLGQPSPSPEEKSPITTLMQTTSTIFDQAGDDQNMIEPPKIKIDVDEIDYTSLLNEKYSKCLECHGDVKPFHTVEVISLIDEKKGLNPRSCIVCHGPKVHDIHWVKLNDEIIVCDTCHSYKDEFRIPVAGKGQLLVCELCHSDGNYIKIHIEGSILENAQVDEKWIKRGTTHQCDTCHIGEYDTIHFEILSDWREGISDRLKEATSLTVFPLNIS
jgi:hypothetical protein